MILWLARAEGLLAHLLWRISFGRLSGRWVRHSKKKQVMIAQEEQDTSIHPTSATVSSFASRLAEFQQERVDEPVKKRPRFNNQRKELSTGMFVLSILLVLSLAIGSFFL